VLLDAVVAGLVLGWVFRGRFVNLAEVEIRGVALAVLGVLLQFVRQYGASAGWPLVREWAPVFYVGTFWILLAVIWLNRRNPAFLLIGFGIFLNMLVIAANGGKMPVSAESLARAGFDPGPIASGQVITHQLLTETTRLAFLADVLVLGKPYPRPVVFSIGDLLLSAGALWCLVGGMLAHPSVTRRPKPLKTRVSLPGLN